MLSRSFRSKRAARIGALSCIAVLGVLALVFESAPTAAAVPADASSPAGTAPKPLPRCKASGLAVWLNTEANNAAGSSFYHLEFTNLRNRTCVLKGYPEVAAVNLADQRLGSLASREFARPRAVRIAPEGSATAVLRIARAGNYSRNECHPTMAAGLRVFPPGQTGSRIVSYPFPACAKSGAIILGIRPVE